MTDLEKAQFSLFCASVLNVVKHKDWTISENERIIDEFTNVLDNILKSYKTLIAQVDPAFVKPIKNQIELIEKSRSEFLENTIEFRTSNGQLMDDYLKAMNAYLQPFVAKKQ